MIYKCNKSRCRKRKISFNLRRNVKEIFKIFEITRVLSTDKISKILLQLRSRFSKVLTEKLSSTIGNLRETLGARFASRNFFLSFLFTVCLLPVEIPPSCLSDIFKALLSKTESFILFRNNFAFNLSNSGDFQRQIAKLRLVAAALHAWYIDIILINSGNSMRIFHKTN